MTTIDGLHKTHNNDVTIISKLKGDIMGKIRECELYKKENKSLTSQVNVFQKKACGLEERKMEHALQLKKLVLDTEALKVKNVEQSKVLKDRSNEQDHKRKLETISFLAKSRQKTKDNDEKRKSVSKLKKFQGGSDQMGLLLGEIRKQTEVNGGCVPILGRLRFLW